ncbi:hypothetical protein D3C81_1504830 [compost metagenome]
MGNTRGAFHISGNGGGTQHSAAANANSVNEHSLAHTLSAFFRILHEAGAVGGAHQGSEGIEQFNESKGNDYRDNPGMDNAIPVKRHKLQLAQIRNPRGFVPGQHVEVHFAHQHGDYSGAQDTEQNGARHIQHHQDGDDHQTDDGQLNSRVFQAAQMEDGFK